MRREVNTTLIGAFVAGAIGLVVVGIFALGEGNLFRKSDQYVLYFTGSVKGLSVGAPVQLKGIRIGEVVDINPIYDASDSTFINQVIFEVPETIVQITGSPPGSGPGKKLLTTDTTIDYMIDLGLRARLQLQSVLTGQLLVAFDFYPESPIRMMRFDDGLREYPTLPSEMEALAKTLDRIDLQVVAESIISAAKGIEALVNSPELHRAIAAVNDTVKQYGQLASHLDAHLSALTTEVETTLAAARRLMTTAEGQVVPMAEGVSETADAVKGAVVQLDERLEPLLGEAMRSVAAAQAAFGEAQDLLANLAQLTDGDAALIRRIDTTIGEYRKLAAAMATMAEYLSRHPEALLWGKKEVN